LPPCLIQQTVAIFGASDNMLKFGSLGLDCLTTGVIIEEIARTSNTRLVGPNCMGF